MVVMGLFFEDYQEGDEMITPARTVTEADVTNYAGVSGDFNSVHTDEEYAKDTVYGSRIAHGILGLAMVSGLRMRLGIMEGTAMAFMGLTWRFTGPIIIGDTIHARITIASKRETKKPDRGIVVQKIELINQRGELVQEGEQTLMIRRKETE